MSRARLRSEEGQSLVEFAGVVLPLVLLVAALLQTGVFFYRQITLNDAVRAAGRAAITCRVSPGVSPSSVGDNAANGLAISWVSGGTCPDPSGLEAGDQLTVSGNASMGNLGFPILGSIFPSSDTKSVTVVVE